MGRCPCFYGPSVKLCGEGRRHAAQQIVFVNWVIVGKGRCFGSQIDEVLQWDSGIEEGGKLLLRGGLGAPLHHVCDGGGRHVGDQLLGSEIGEWLFAG